MKGNDVSSDNLPPSDNLTTQVRLAGGAPLPWIMLGLVIAAVAGLFFFGKLALRPNADTPEGRTQALQEMARTNADFGRSVDSARHKADWRDAENRLKAAQASLLSLVASNTELETQFKSLLDSPEGKRIATNGEWVTQFIALRDRKRPSADDIRVHQQSIEELLPVCGKAIQDDEIAIACDKLFIDKVTALQRAALEAAESIDSTTDGLRTLTRLSEGATPGDIALSEAIATEEARRSVESLTLLTQEQNELRQEAERLARERTTNTERRLHAAAAEQSQAEDALKIAEAEARSEQAKQIVQNAQEMLAVEQARLTRLTQFERALPEIRSLLSPMVSNGRMQLGQSGWVEGESGPLSYAALLETPAFRRINDDSWRNLGAMFCGPSCPNDRPRGSFPSTMSYHEGELRKAIQLVTEYGDLMVERKLLRP